MAKLDKLTVIQANLGRGRLATEEILQKTSEIRAPILLLQEPYTFQGRVAGLGKFSNRIFTGGGADATP